MAAGKAWQPAQCMRPRPKLTAAAARGAIRSAMKPARTAPFSTCEQAQTGVIHSAGVHAACRARSQRGGACIVPQAPASGMGSNVQ